MKKVLEAEKKAVAMEVAASSAAHEAEMESSRRARSERSGRGTNRHRQS